VTDRLFPLEEVPEVPLFREPRRRKGEGDARFVNDYPPEWDRCPSCGGTGRMMKAVAWSRFAGTEAVMHSEEVPCPTCLGMGSAKARVRLEAGHRCERCRHPYVPKGDALMLGVQRSGMHPEVVAAAEALPGGGDAAVGDTVLRWTPWSTCDEQCWHSGPMRVWTTEGWTDFAPTPEACGAAVYAFPPGSVEAQWRVLTVHHLDGDKANLSWWNLAALCQRCHLEIQAKVVMERVYPHEHSAWFKPHAAGYYARVYLGEDLSRDSVAERLDELLALERAA
jgi:hypothetical protein